MASVRVNLTDATATFGPFPVPDGEDTATFSFTAWTTPSPTVTLAPDITFDGTTWFSLGTVTIAGGPVDPRSTDCGVTFSPLPLICSICGAFYQAGDRRYTRALSHSIVELRPGKTIQELRIRLRRAGDTRTLADFQTSIAVDGDGRDVDDEFFVRTFHTPTPVLPANRQLRVTATVQGSINRFLSILTAA